MLILFFDPDSTPVLKPRIWISFACHIKFKHFRGFFLRYIFSAFLKIFDKYVSSKYPSVMAMGQNDNDTKIMIIQG